MPIKVAVTKSGESSALAELVFDKDGISVGRARDCDVSLKDPAKAIAPTHGFIQRVGDDYFYIDYGAKLGTTVNGKPSPGHEMTSLKHGDVVQIGPYRLDLEIGPGLKATPKAEERAPESAPAPAVPAKQNTKQRKRTVEDAGTVLSIAPSDEGARKITDKTNSTEVPPTRKAEAAKTQALPSKVKEPAHASEIMDESDAAGLTMALSDFSTTDLKNAAQALRAREAAKPEPAKKRNTKIRTRTTSADGGPAETKSAEEVDDSESDIAGLTMAVADISSVDLKKAALEAKSAGASGKKRGNDTRAIDDLLSRISAKEEPEAIALPSDDSPKVGNDMQGAAFQVLKMISDQFTGRGDFETPEQVRLFGTLIAQTLEVTLDWMNKSLKGRAEFEGQFEAFVTMAFAREKNPMKSVKDAMEVRRLPLDWKSGKDPEELKKQLISAFRDLTQHQLGLMEGVQRAINEIMKKLDPQAVEEEANKNASGLFKSLGAEKRAWRQYALTYSALLGESGKLFNEVVFPNIRKGYLESHTKDAPAAKDTKEKA
ncbi:MAG: FHA domain-containing protein [Planctomycetes bacterium]|nr:FHA domain-containing protein [Planctomycetota bacterium]